MNNHQMRTSFMQSPLVTWVKTLLDEDCTEYSDLCNGLLLNKAWLQIDPHPSHLGNSISPAIATAEITSLTRIRNLNNLLNNIRNFYENVLDQILVLELPDVIKIALNCNDDLVLSITQDNPFYGLIQSYSSNTNCDDMRKFLLLILGCAVQCEQKEIFIEKIKQLDISIQHSIVEGIQQITDNPESVFLITEWAQLPEDEAEKDRLYTTFVNHLSRLTKERDQLYQRVVELTSELFNLTFNANLSNINSASLKNLSLSNSSLSNNINHCDQKSHYLVELADVKSKLRRLQQELEEKNEIVVELREIIEQNKEFCNKLRHDNLELTQEARTAKAYRDEIDVLNERVRKIDRMEAEVQRYRDKMNELDYFKSRVDELREDNRILGETKNMLEEQLEASRKRSEKLPELEEKILKLNAFGNELNLQRELDRNQIERLIEEITHLRQEKKEANEELSKVQLELSDLRTQIRVNSETSLVKSEAEEGNLYEQINQDATKRLIKLEHENQKLQNLLEDYKNNFVDIDSLVSMFPELECYSINKEERKDGTDSGFNSNKSKMEKLNDLKESIDKLKINQNSFKQMENCKLELERELGELKGKLHDSEEKYETLERNHAHSCADIQKYQRIIEQKSKKINEFIAEMEALECENQMLVTNADSLKLSLRKMNDLEIEMTNLEGDKHRLEQERKSLEKEINRLKTSIDYKDKVIDQNATRLSSLELENKKFKKEIESLGQLSGKLKEVEKENKDLTNAVNVQKNTLTVLQQDLVAEKLRTQKFTDEFEKIMESINHLYMENGLNDLKLETDDSENLSLIVSDCFQCVIENCLLKKDSEITDLESELDRLRANNLEMQTVINCLKRQLNIDEESDMKSSLNSLNELQRKILHLEDESKSLKAELSSQNESYSELMIKNEMTESKLAQVNERNSELVNENAKLEVENSLLKSQNSSLDSQTMELQQQMASIQDSIEGLREKCDEYESTHKSLMADNDSLQRIHQQLTADYDHLMQTHGNLKQSYKALKAENKTLEEQLNLLLKKHEELVNKTGEELKSLKEQQNKLDSEDESLKEKLNSLTGEHKSLSEEHMRLQTEHKMLQNIYKKLRSDNNELKLKHTELQGETAECKDRMNSLNVEVSKLSSYCEMVALTNNTLESQRKKLATQSASLLTQYNDLLLELSNGCEKSVLDKLRDLCIKKERLEKMFKDYDISIEKNMPRVSNKRHLPDGRSNFDDAIYGRLWEAETPPIHHPDSALTNSTVILRQYSLNNQPTPEKEKKSCDFSRSPPPRVPPRQQPHIQRQSVNLSQVNETSIEVTQLPNSPMENKMSINVSTRSPSVQIGKTPDSHSLESSISKLQIASNSPLISKPSSTISSSISNGNGYFMRGSFKSISVNYGNYLRPSIDPSHGKLANTHGGNRRGHHSPQLFLAASGTNHRSHGSHSPNIVNTLRAYPPNPASPSLNSDSSSSHSPHDESEKESDIGVMGSYIGNSNNNNMSTRSRITISNNCTSIISSTSSSKPMPNGGNKDNISIQISNALNNNTETANTGTNCTNGIPNDNSTTTATATSNSIWYEYGCV